MIIKCKCLDCNKDFNAFIFPRKEGEKLIGHSLTSYPCPYCMSIKKGRYKDKKGRDIQVKYNNNLFDK